MLCVYVAHTRTHFIAENAENHTILTSDTPKHTRQSHYEDNRVAQLLYISFIIATYRIDPTAFRLCVSAPKPHLKPTPARR